MCYELEGEASPPEALLWPKIDEDEAHEWMLFFFFGEPPVLDIFLEIVSDLNISKYIEYF